MLVEDYIKKIETQKNKKYKPGINKKYEILKKYSIILTIVTIISTACNFI